MDRGSHRQQLDSACYRSLTLYEAGQAVNVCDHLFVVSGAGLHMSES